MMGGGGQEDSKNVCSSSDGAGYLGLAEQGFL